MFDYTHPIINSFDNVLSSFMIKIILFPFDGHIIKHDFNI